MKILIFKNSILLLRIKPKTNTVDCFFIFAISWNCYKRQQHTFEIGEILLMRDVKNFYIKLADDWTGIYRI